MYNPTKRRDCHSSSCLSLKNGPWVLFLGVSAQYFWQASQIDQGATDIDQGLATLRGKAVEISELDSRANAPESTEGQNALPMPEPEPTAGGEDHISEDLSNKDRVGWFVRLFGFFVFAFNRFRDWFRR